MTDARADLVVTNASQVLTMVPAPGTDHPSLGIVRDGAVAVRSGRVVWVGPASAVGPLVTEATTEVDARGGVVTPGLIDPHTHAVFAGSRHEEYEARLAGRPYLEILAAGGGILSTVGATRAASDRELVEATRARLDRMLAQGVTTVEVKSGYGLDVEAELRLLRIAREAGAGHPIRVYPTLLGAHALPDEHRSDRSSFVRLVAEQMIPRAAKEGLARACDVYLERAAFSLDEARAILVAAKSAGLAAKLHAGQFNDLGGGQLAAEVGALSADHLEELGDEGLRAMSAAGVVAVLLPGAALSLRGRFPDARRMIDGDLCVALATDCNPGTSYTENLLLMATLAVSQMGMTIEEALHGITASAAIALGLEDEIGQILPGHRADLTIWDVPDFRCLVYHFGVPHTARVIAGGRVVW